MHELVENGQALDEVELRSRQLHQRGDERLRRDSTRSELVRQTGYCPRGVVDRCAPEREAVLEEVEPGVRPGPHEAEVRERRRRTHARTIEDGLEDADRPAPVVRPRRSPLTRE